MSPCRGSRWSITKSWCAGDRARCRVESCAFVFRHPRITLSKMNSPLPAFTRRQFLRTTAAASALGFPAILRGQNAGDKLNLAIIGCGGRGAGDMAEVMSENIVALCDVNANTLRAASKNAPGAKTFRDFREMYDTLKDSEFDAVVVATTEHTHAFATLRRKKHVFCLHARRTDKNVSSSTASARWCEVWCDPGRCVARDRIGCRRHCLVSASCCRVP